MTMNLADNTIPKNPNRRNTDSAKSMRFSERFSVKDRIFLYYMVFYAVVALITVAANILSGFDFIYNYKWIGLFIFCVVLATLAYRNLWKAVIHRIGVYAVAFIILPASWLTSSGLSSPAIIYSIAVLMLINFMLIGVERNAVNIVFILMNMSLISLFRFHPEFFISMTFNEQFLDWIVNVALVFGLLSVSMIIFERAYEIERQRNTSKSDALELMTRTDPLTGVYNRLHLMNDLELCIQKFRYNGSMFSVIILDIDHFKKYNDFYGHVMGDESLVRFSSVLKSSIRRKEDRVYRYGGEEFLLILADMGWDGAVQFAEGLRTAIKDEAIPHEKSDVAQVLTASMGIAVYNKPNLTAMELLNQADTALYSAKDAGRDSISG